MFLSCSIISVKDTNTPDSIISQLDEKFNKSVEKKIPGAVIVFIKDGEDNNFIITMDSLKMMLEPEAKIRGIMAALLGKGAGMGLGLFTFDLGNGRKTYGHGGGNQGWTSYFEFCPDTRDGMILLTNGNVTDFKIVQPLEKAWNKYIKNQ